MKELDCTLVKNQSNSIKFYSHKNLLSFGLEKWYDLESKFIEDLETNTITSEHKIYYYNSKISEKKIVFQGTLKECKNFMQIIVTNEENKINLVGEFVRIM